MKITGFMPIKNGISGGYPFLEAIISVLPVVDEFLIADGESDDGTWQALTRLANVFRKVKLYKVPWKKSEAWLWLDETIEYLISLATGDWVFEVQGDEVWHEKDVKNLRSVIEDANQKSYNSIRSMCIESLWDALNLAYDYRNVRILKKVPGLMSYWGGDDFQIGEWKTVEGKYLKHHIPPELGVEFGFHHFHRVFPDNCETAFKLIKEELASGVPARQEFHEPHVPSSGKIFDGLPAIMKDLAYKKKYEVRDEIFDKMWLNRTTGLDYGVSGAGYLVQKSKEFLETGELSDRFEKCNERRRLYPMELFSNFDLDNFLRVVWLTKEAKDAWEGVFVEADKILPKLEIESVVKRHRQCSWQTVEEKSYENHREQWASRGLCSEVVKRVRYFEGFAHRHLEPIEGEPALVCCIVAQDARVIDEFKEAIDKSDHYAQGILLGYPKCCSQFFADVWAQGYIDPIWQAATKSTYDKQGQNHLRVSPSYLVNPLLRFVKVRLSFHLSCSFKCEESRRISKQRLELLKEMDSRLAEKFEQLLQMPMSWDCYHGIAIIRTPIFYFITNSSPTVERFLVEFEGDFIPLEAKKGLSYPNNLV